MNVVLISIDSLRRDVLEVYRDEPTGFGYQVATPNLDRFAERAAVFDTHYAGSLPCMPARREWLTGTQEFLWRSWGPIEPFDAPIPRLARASGIVTQLITDHYHYFQHGSHGYYEDFNGYEFVRGHEWDAHRTNPRTPPDRTFASQLNAETGAPSDLVNRTVYARNVADVADEREYFAPRVFRRTAEWLTENREWDEWFCYVDSFDVHEPFDVPESYASMYTDEPLDDSELTIWPFYGRIDGEGDGPDSPGGSGERLSDRQVEFVTAQFAAKTTMTDRWFGRVLETLDEQERWEDTMVIVTSDHGHYLGDHGWMGKPFAPIYDVLAHTPLFIWHPETARTGETIDALTSAVDLYATILDALGIDADRRHGRSLIPLLEGTTERIREWAIYGYWGSSVNITDGRYTYLHPCEADDPTYCYSASMMNPYPDQFQPPRARPDAECGSFLPYAEAPVWRYPAESHARHADPLLFDVRTDPDQLTDLVGTDGETEIRMRGLLTEALRELGAPQGQYDRLALSGRRT
ncbi:sulfatase-like hydrolase/transferase [Halosolutus halophilus]|uniref:sulfatase-like hydrolase/transferase n=1 Tax=Halosolutus halophilus TaxID=1552990 RepID=UPI0022353052|nr:sulfatase-like hydrolase/transferase [Halosolutus halophilus]